MNALSDEAILEPVEFDPFAGNTLERVIPTSEAQREVWLADKLSREASLAFNESGSLRLRGRLDREALAGALNGLLARHDALRSTVSPDGTELLVNASASIELTHIDLERLGAEDRAAALRAATAAAVTTPFDLEQGPLLRAALYRLSEVEHVLLMTAHHIVCDGWSWGVMVESMGALYAELTGAAPGPEPAPSYADYVAWETAETAGAAMAEHEKFWLARFAGSSLPVLDLMTDRPRAAVRSFKADRVDHALDAALVAEVRKLGAKAGASAFAAFFSGFAATLHRLTGQDDLVIGVPAAGQSASGMTGLVGHCVNLLPVRTAVDGSQSFDALLRQSSSTLLDAFDHQTLTYGTLLTKLPVRRDPSRLPLVSVMFNVDQAIKGSATAFPGLTLEYANNARQFENFELFVNAAQHEQGMRLECQYNTDLFDAATVRRWMCAYEALLRAAVRAPDQTVARLDWISADERAALRALQPTPTALPAAELMHSAIVRQCAVSPDAVALSHQGDVISYRELDARSNRLARVLRERGIGAGERVGLCLPRNPDMVVSLLAVLKAGGTYVPLDPGFPQARLAYYAEDARLTLLLTDSSITTAPLAWRADAAERVLRLDQDRAWLGASSEALVPSPRDAAPDSTAYIIYTSGSTGKPKGVCLPHRAAANFLASMAREPGMTGADRLAAVTTLSFDIAVLELLLPLSVGAQVIIVPRDTAMDGNLLRELLESTGATMMQATPGMWRMLLDTPWNGGEGFKCLVGGESLPADLAYDMLGRCGELWNMYGPTETTVWSTLWRVQREVVAQRGVSIGGPIANTSVWILNADLQPCPIGVPGEICIGGSGVAQGYLDRPELTADRFVADPFSAAAGARLYRTGDRGRWRSDGTLEHLGRLDFQVKVRGYRIELGEIEAGCNDMPGVAQSVVLAREDNPGDVRLVAYVTLNSGASIDETALRAHLRGRLPDYMLPQHVVVLDRVPLLPNGKVDRKALPAPTVTHLPSAQRVAPRTDLERSIAGAMQGVLKLPDIGVLDDFFALGGHSLLAARLIGLINRDLDVQLSLRTLFESPTVEKLAAAVEKYRGAPTANKREAITRREQQDRAPLTLMQERIRFIEEMYPGRVDYNTPSAHRLSGPMDVAAFEWALNEMVRRQPALRTRIVATSGGYVQQVDEPVHHSLQPVEDLSHLAPAERERAVKARIDGWIAQTFALDKGALFVARLLRLGEQEHVFFFMPHHIIWDGWSFDLLYVEMSAHYEARLAQRASTLALPPVSYGDFAQWHHRWLAGEEIRLQKEYWKEQFAKFGTSREPFADLQRTPDSPGVGGITLYSIDAAEAERIRELAKKTGTTLSIVAMTAFAAVMSKWLADAQPVIGLPVRGRPSPELENVMGFFNNMLPLRVPVDTALSGLDLIRSLRQTLLQVYANQDVPFELVAQELGVGKRGAPTRLYHVMFTFQDVRQRPVQWGGLSHARIPLDLKGVTEDINLGMVDTHSGIVGDVRYDADIFLPETVDDLRDRFLTVLRQMVREPQQPVARWLSANEAELAQVSRWARPAAHARKGPLEALARHAASRPDAAAVVHGERRISFADLAHQVEQAAETMRAMPAAGVQQGHADPIARLVTTLAAWSAAGAAPQMQQAAETVAALAGEFKLTPDDTVATLDSARTGQAQLGALLALDAGATWCAVAPNDPVALRPGGAVRRAALMVGAPNDWATLLATPDSVGAGAIALVDVRDLPQNLMADLLKSGLRVFSSLSDDRIGLVLAGGWLDDRRQVGLFGRPLVGADGTVQVVVQDALGQPAAPGLAGTLGLRHGDGATDLLGVAARWRIDGVLQYLGAATHYEAAPVAQLADARPHAATSGDLTVTEQALADVWSSLLGQSGIGRADNFFDLGGTSLMAMQAATLLEQRLNKRIPARRFVFDSLGQLAAAYDETAPLQDADASSPAAAPQEAAEEAAPRGLFKRLAGLVKRG